MRPGPQAAPIELTERQRAALELLKQDDKAQIRRRAEIVLVCAQGLSDTDVAVEVGTSRGTVGKWRRAFTQGGLAALSDAPRTGRRKVTLPPSAGPSGKVEPGGQKWHRIDVGTPESTRLRP